MKLTLDELAKDPLALLDPKREAYLKRFFREELNFDDGEIQSAKNLIEVLRNAFGHRYTLRELSKRDVADREGRPATPAEAMMRWYGSDFQAQANAALGEERESTFFGKLRTEQPMPTCNVRNVWECLSALLDDLCFECLKCKWCGRFVELKKEGQIYCSDECEKAHKRPPAQ